MLVIHGGTVVAAGMARPADVVITEGRITAIDPPDPALVRQVVEGSADSLTKADGVIDATGLTVCPGFIDLQVNGLHGVDVTSEPERVHEIAAALVQYGVTSFLPTVISASPDVYRRALNTDVNHVSGARILGWHFEGPMLSRDRPGVHPVAHLVAPTLGVIDGWSAEGGVVLVTMAPELPGALDVVEELARRGVIVSLGHSAARHAQANAAFGRGATCVTHLFNAMEPLHHRAPGLAGAALANDGVTVALIADGIHVHPDVIKLAWRACGPDRIVLVSDAVAALGDPRRMSWRIGAVDVIVDGAAARAADGSLAGSVVPLDEAVRNLIEFTRCDVVEAVATVTSSPAAVLGREDVGDVRLGIAADLTLLDIELRPVLTIVGGDVVHGSERLRRAGPT